MLPLLIMLAIQVVMGGTAKVGGGTTIGIIASSPIASLTAANTSTCSANGAPAGCTAAFIALTDHCNFQAPTACDGTNQPYNPPGPPTVAAASNTQTVTTVPSATNISLANMKTLMYAGFNGLILCVFQPWFGNNQHISIGKDLSSPTVEVQERNNMIARGCDIAVLNWYGQTSFPDSVAQVWRNDLDTCRTTLAGGCLKLTFQADHGTVSGGTIGGFETDVTYTFNNYMNHPSWWQITFGGKVRPIYITFGWGGTLANADWGTIKTFIHTNLATGTGEPILIAEGTNGLSAFTNLDGANNWVGVDNYDNAASGTVTLQGISGTVQFNPHFLTGNSFSTDDFYTQALAAEGNGRVQIGVAYPGFNDTNADSTGWGFQAPHTQGRKNARQCGQVWLNAFKRASVAGYSVAHQLKYMMIATWNDYEEGTAIEPGIDGCFTPGTSLASSNLTVTLTKNDATFASLTTVNSIDIYASSDGGTTGTRIGSLAPSLSQVTDLNTYPLLQVGTTYRIYAYMVGIAGLQNKLTSFVSFTR
jgi:hypothetical protein